MAEPRGDYEPLLDEGSARWSAGPVAECGSRSSQPHAHAVTALHVIARCSCGAAYMSTDAGIAFHMAKAHAEHSARTEGSDD